MAPQAGSYSTFMPSLLALLCLYAKPRSSKLFGGVIVTEHGKKEIGHTDSFE
jgi:hypothetical protein